MNLIKSLFVFIIFFLTACGGSEVDVKVSPNSSNPVSTGNYSGPAPGTADVQKFRVNFWNNVVADNRCGQCHNENGQAPTFARFDNVNEAYSAIQNYINRNIPANSAIVEKVAGGHNCWLSNDSACGDIMTTWITGWISDSTSVTGNSITLTAPIIREPGTSKNFPANSNSFSTTVYPVLREYCAGCHAEGVTTPQSPYFASANIDTAYQAIQSKIDLTTPENSRIVVRLSQEFHNCWSNCTANAQEMLDAVNDFVDPIPTNQIDADLIASKALTLREGIVASQGGRHETDLIAKYEFKTGSGQTAFDTSGVEPALHLSLSGDVTWVGGWGIQINNGRAQGSTTASKKLHDLITSTGEYSIEAWVAPGNVSQEGPARIISYSGSTTLRNFALGQTQYNYDFLQRTSTSNANGEPGLSTEDADEILQATLQHVVTTFSPENGQRIYVNGELVAENTAAIGAGIGDWSDQYALVLGNEVSGNRLWKGVIRMLAIHNRALTTEQIQQNYQVGVGEKFYLLFSISALTDLPESFLVFEVSQFDSYSYLFNAPFIVSLDDDATAESINIRGIRIGINGQEADIGQAYSNINFNLNTNDAIQEGVPVSTLGTIIGLQLGPDLDDFFITFDRIGDFDYARVDSGLIPESEIVEVLTEQSDIGLRQFSEINASMSVLTGVNSNTPAIKELYQTIEQQLPTVESIDSFLSSHQMAVTQLAIKYCDSLIEDSLLRSTIFPTVNFNVGPNSAYDAMGQSNLINHLYDQFIGDNQIQQPTNVEIEEELNDLITTLKNCTNCNTTDRTKTIAKASCAAVLSSATMILQ
ncbi:MAG: LamG domain-containing protein [Pseudomonadota bacterium]